MIEMEGHNVLYQFKIPLTEKQKLFYDGHREFLDKWTEKFGVRNLFDELEILPSYDWVKCKDGELKNGESQEEHFWRYTKYVSKAFRKIALHLHPDTTIRKLNAGEITKEKATENGEYLKLLTKGVALINGNAGPMQIPDKNDYAKWKAQKDAGANVADLHDAKKEGYFVEYYGRFYQKLHAVKQIQSMRIEVSEKSVFELLNECKKRLQAHDTKNYSCKRCGGKHYTSDCRHGGSVQGIRGGIAEMELVYSGENPKCFCCGTYSQHVSTECPYRHPDSFTNAWLCWNCGLYGHKKNRCRHPPYEPANHTNIIPRINRAVQDGKAIPIASSKHVSIRQNENRKRRQPKDLNWYNNKSSNQTQSRGNNERQNPIGNDQPSCSHWNR